MRKRVSGRADGGGPASSSAQSKTARGGENKGSSKLWLWVKRGSFALCALCLIMPIVVEIPEFVRQRIYYHRIRVPFVFDLGQPADLALNHTVNMYLTPEEGISLGVWHTVPDFMWKEAQGKDSAWYQRSLKDGSPVFIYLHGSTQTRAAKHRVGVIKVLSAMGYHVLSVDYRGFGDSTGEPTEDALTKDAVWLYLWAKERSADSQVLVWGHSLGSGVTTNTAVRLMEQGVLIDGIILDGAFKTAKMNPPPNLFLMYAALYRQTIKRFLLRDESADFVLPNEENLKTMKSPLLILHAEDDHLVRVQTAQELYQTSVRAQGAERVRVVTFEGSLGYLHNGIYRDPRLPAIIENFVLSVEEMS